MHSQGAISVHCFLKEEERRRVLSHFLRHSVHSCKNELPFISSDRNLDMKNSLGVGLDITV
jgi:hypothetical protein